MFYAELGAAITGGEVTKLSALKADPNLAGYYWLMNFNDFYYSLVTLFHIMIVNNWFVTTNMYVAIYDGAWWPIFFFASFWVFSVLILLNIVTASVIEIYAASTESVFASFDRIENASWLKRKFKGWDDEMILSRV